MSTRVIVGILGWAGMLLILIGYVMVSSGRSRGDSRWYQLANFVGSVFLIVYTTVLGAYANTALNVVWAGIAVFTLATAGRRARATGGRT